MAYDLTLQKILKGSFVCFSELGTMIKKSGAGECFSLRVVLSLLIDNYVFRLRIRKLLNIRE